MLGVPQPLATASRGPRGRDAGRGVRPRGRTAHARRRRRLPAAADPVEPSRRPARADPQSGVRAGEHSRARTPPHGAPACARHGARGRDRRPRTSSSAERRPPFSTTGALTRSWPRPTAVGFSAVATCSPSSTSTAAAGTAWSSPTAASTCCTAGTSATSRRPGRSATCWWWRSTATTASSAQGPGPAGEPARGPGRGRRAIECVDHVTAFEEDTPAALIELVRPEVYAKGGDYPPEMVPEAPLVGRLGGQVRVLATCPTTRRRRSSPGSAPRQRRGAR